MKKPAHHPLWRTVVMIMVMILRVTTTPTIMIIMMRRMMKNNEKTCSLPSPEHGAGRQLHQAVRRWRWSCLKRWSCPK